MSDEAFTTAQANAAMHGITLQRIDPAGGTGSSLFIVSRWNNSRSVASLDEALSLIKRMTGGKP